MPSSNPKQRFNDILDEIAFLNSALSGKAVEDLIGDGVLRRSVERAYAIISEAAVKLGDLAVVLAPEIRWDQIRGLGNFIRHEYGEIDYEILIGVYENDLSALQAACEKARDGLAE